MAPSAHSQFSASGSARLLACPGSFSLARAVDDGTRRSSIFAAEGTLAHMICEVCISTGCAPHMFIGQKRTVDGFTIEIDAAFADACDPYVNYVRGLRAMGYVVALERRVDPSRQWDGLDPLPIDLFGTGDCIAYHPASRSLAIGDLKFGAGVAVEAGGNTQLRYYGAGAAHEDVLRPICQRAGVPFNGVDRVSMTIIQPRKPHPEGPVRRDELTMDELRTWARTTLYEGVKAALADDGTTTDAGAWCRWCPALAHCDKPRALAVDTAKAAFLNTPLHNVPAPNDPNTILPDKHLSDDVLADVLDKIDVIEPWIKALRELAHDRLSAGRKLTGRKLVPKAGRRRWTDDQDAILGELKARGFSPDQITNVKLLSPAQIERSVGKGAYKDRVADLITSVSAGTEVVSDGDPRQRIERRNAADAFGVQTGQKTPDADGF